MLAWYPQLEAAHSGDNPANVGGATLNMRGDGILGDNFVATLS
jgi:hypothetical protein